MAVTEKAKAPKPKEDRKDKDSRKEGTIDFYPMSITYKEVRDRALINMFGRTSSGEQICLIDESFLPYFYVDLNKGESTDLFLSKLKGFKVEKRDGAGVVLDTSFETKRYMNEDMQLIKIFVNTPAAVNNVRHEIKEWKEVRATYEYDIPFVRRYLVDKNITPMTLCSAAVKPSDERYKVKTYSVLSISQKSDDTLTNPRILGFDIETYNPRGKIYDPAQFPIIMISFYGDNFEKVITWKRFKTDKKYIEFVEGEAELIGKIKDTINEFKPDIIAGYYSDMFDLPYIKTRAEKYKINLDLGLDYSTVKLKRGAFEATELNGIIHLDVYKFITKVVGRKLETDSYDLNSVSMELLDDGKAEVELDNLAGAWDSGSEALDKFCEYNLKDSYLSAKLCEKILPNMIEFVKIVGLPLYDINRMGFSQLVEWFIIKHVREFNELIPSRPGYNETMNRQHRTYQGAFVFEPTPGLFNNIAVFDFRSLYPSIITSHNISPSTFRCGCCEGKENVPGEKGYWFCKNKRGLLPALIEDLISRRMRVKEIIKASKDKSKLKLLEARSEALKVLANSFYGYMGFASSRWYSLESAKSITAYARYYIQDVIQKAQKENFKVLYSDTDSIFLSLEDRKEQDAVKFIEEINNKLPEMMELEYEGFYPRGIFVSAKMGEYGAKKKYAMISDKGIIKIRGFETVRRNMSEIAKETQENVINIILNEEDIKKAVKKAVHYVNEVVGKLQSREVPLAKVIITTQLRKGISEYESEGPHVAIAKKMKEKGMDVEAGTRISYVITSGKGRIRDKARMVDDVKEGDYDPDYYINNQVLPSVEGILKVLGVNELDFKGHKDQSNLSKFF